MATRVDAVRAFVFSGESQDIWGKAIVRCSLIFFRSFYVSF